MLDGNRCGHHYSCSKQESGFVQDGSQTNVGVTMESGRGGGGVRRKFHLCG